MNQVEHLLVVLNEEAIEIAHITDKILRFGGDDRNVLNPTGATNVQRLCYELNDFMASVQLLVDLGVIPKDWQSFDQQGTKKNKIYEFMAYARAKGILH